MAAATDRAPPTTSPEPFSATELAPSIRSLEIGLFGSITADVFTSDVDGDGEEEVFVGTSSGLYVISGGELLYRITTAQPVNDIALLDGSPRRSLVLATDDTYFPNLRCYDAATGTEMWGFVPSQEVFIDNVMWTWQQTPTFDLEAADLDSDGAEDVLATSGYNLFALEGGTGRELWKFAASNNLWKVAKTSDMDGDGVPDVIAGSQIGLLYLLSGRDGSLIWQHRIAERYTTIDSKGKPGYTVDRSIWDIVPLEVRGKPQALVSAEDGKVRLVDLQDGSAEWEVTLVEYVAAQQHRLYQQKMGRPTSPGEPNFFNLRLMLTADLTDDGVPEVLAYTNAGRGDSGGSGGSAVRSDLVLLDSATGGVMFQRSDLSLDIVRQMSTATYSGSEVLLLPRGKSDSAEQIALLDLRSGNLKTTLQIPSTPQSGYLDEYVVLGLSGERLLLGSNEGDLVMASASQGILWDYPRVTEVQVEQGDFVGDDTEDLLLTSVTRPLKNWGRSDAAARVLSVFDGATTEEAWTYQMPYEEYVTSGGIFGITVIPDVDGDGRQDIVGFTQPADKQTEVGPVESLLVLFSGRNGVPLLRQPVIEQEYYGVWEEIYKDPSALEQGIREGFEQRMKSDFVEKWAHHEEEQRRKEDEQLQQEMEKRRNEGMSEADLSAFEQQWQYDLERRLEEEKAQWEQNWRQDFEQNQLPAELDKWEREIGERREKHRIDKQVISLSVIRSASLEPGVAFFIATNRDVFILSPEGEMLWTRTYEPWHYQDPFTGEERPEMQFGLLSEQGSCYRVPGDLNGDGIDDLIGFAHNRVVVGLSDVSADGLEFHEGVSFDLKQGIDPRRGRLADDLDGDGTGEFLFQEYQEGKEPTGIFVSPVTGEVVLRVPEFHDEGTTLRAMGKDLDGDGRPDSALFRRWGGDGPSLTLLSTGSGQPLWEFQEYRDDYLFRQVGYDGAVMPATAIADVSGDGVADLALAKNLIWQPGAFLVLYDVVHNQVVKEIVLEKKDPSRNQEERWHPAFLVAEVGDWNGDGTEEVAVLTALGETAEQKQFRLIVVDISKGEAIADFSKVGIELITTESEGQLGLIGTDGGFYLLRAANDLQITSPSAGSKLDSPVDIRWTGVPRGSFSTVFVDGVEVARTNEMEATLALSEGEHELTVRSVDEYGGGVYQTITLTVEKSSAPVLWSILSLVVACGIVAWFPLSRLVASRRRRARRHG